jgi:predicted enzyme related to lactoylglutathione lyase
MAQARFRGRFVWQELMTEDTAAASAFYSKLLGWHARPSGGDPAYTEFHAGGKGVAGMMKMPDSAKSMGAKPMWMPYVTVDEVDSAVTEIGHLGGKTVRPPSDIPNVGRFAVMSDPQGAVFAIIKPIGPPPAPPAPPKAGEFSWMELATTDHEAAFTFYSKVFGWEALGRHDMGPMGTYLIFGSDGVQRGGMFKMAAHHGGHPYWLPYAAVGDADASAAVVIASGGRIVNGPMDVPDGGRIAQLTDPGGVLFAVHSQVKPKVQPAAKPAAPAHSAPPPKPAAAPTPAPKPAVAPKPAAAPPPLPKPAPVTAPPTLKPVTPVAAAKPAAAAPVAPAATSGAPAKKAAAKKPAAKKKPAAAKKKPVAKKKAKQPAKKAKKKVAAKARKSASAKGGGTARKSSKKDKKSKKNRKKDKAKRKK